MARPRKNEDEVLSKHVPTRWTKSDYALISEKARQAGLTVSEFIRKAATDQEIIVRYKRRGIDERVLAQLIKLANNVNQIARKCNAQNVAPPRSLTDFITRINPLIDKLTEQKI